MTGAQLDDTLQLWGGARTWPDPDHRRTEARENGAGHRSECAAAADSSEFSRTFRQLAPHLEQRGHELGCDCLASTPIALKGRVLRYEEPVGLKSVPLGTQIWHEGLERAARVAFSPSSWNRKDGAQN